jgi:hypothetical protein
MSTSQNSQVWKTLALIYAPEWFERQLASEISRHAGKARDKGMHPRIRLDGTSDSHLGEYYARRFPNVDFYDYTKNPGKAIMSACGDMPKNYRVTFSLAESNFTQARYVAECGGNVAVVFRTRKPEEFPSRFLELPVIDGDETDDRFDDPRGVVVGLTVKGNKADKDRTGFVQEVS